MHSIRLRGPWQFKVLPDFDQEPGSGEIRLPCDWAELLTPPGRLELKRMFNAPTGIESAEVRVTIEHLGPPEDLDPMFRINGNAAPYTHKNSLLEIDVTPHLLPHNELALEVTLQPQRTYHGEITIRIFDE